MKCWMRLLQIELTSKINPHLKMVFGNTKLQTKRKYEHGVPSPTINDSLTIKVDGAKYPATNKDKGTLTICNLTYETIIKIKTMQYYMIKIYCGYQSMDEKPFPIFEGEIAYMSPKIYSNHDVEVYIIYTSALVARYSQNRMNFSLNSGVNLYAAMNYMLASQGVQKKNIDSRLKNAFINEYKTLYGKASTILDSATLNNVGDYSISTDGIDGNVIDITTLKGKRTILVNEKFLPIGSGNPTVTSEGLSMTLLPVRNFKVGDILKINNALINTSISSAESVPSTFNTNYLDASGGNLVNVDGSYNKEASYGYYMIVEMHYTLENRGNSFQYQIKGRALSIIKNLAGVSE